MLRSVVVLAFLFVEALAHPLCYTNDRFEEGLRFWSMPLFPEIPVFRTISLEHSVLACSYDRHRIVRRESLDYAVKWANQRRWYVNNPQVTTTSKNHKPYSTSSLNQHGPFAVKADWYVQDGAQILPYTAVWGASIPSVRIVLHGYRGGCR